MHSTLGVEGAADREGFMHAVVSFAKPFRISARCGSSICCRSSLSSPSWCGACLRWQCGSLLQRWRLPIANRLDVIDEFAARSCFLFRLLARQLCVSACAYVDFKPWHAAAGLAAWALVNGLLVSVGYADWPLVSLDLGEAGVAAVIVVAVLLTGRRRSIRSATAARIPSVIYLGFFLPMGATRMLAAQERYYYRCRHNRADGHNGWRCGRARHVVGGTPDPAEFPLCPAGWLPAGSGAAAEPATRGINASPALTL